MNRTTVLILALVLFLAHILALHHDQVGAFALPSDIAHVNFQVGRNLVHGQGSVWWPGGSPAAILEEGGTSLAWILVAAWAEFWSWSPVRTTAAVGILAALLAVACTARLSRERLVGVTATVLLVVSGPFAASAADGTETALVTFLVTLAFLSLERRRSAWLGGSLALLVLTSSLASVYALGFLLAALHARRCGDGALSLPKAFVPPLLALGALLVGRMLHGAPALTPDLQLLLHPDGERLALGLLSLESLVRGTVAPLLLLLPLAQLVLGKLSGTGGRALLLGLLVLTTVVLTGASGRPMHAAFVPALPLLYLAVQEGVVGGLDRRPQLEGLAWCGLALACLGSVLASKIPGDLGPIGTDPVLSAMARSRAPVAEAWGNEWSGRLHLAEDLQHGDRLRALGIFVRDQVSPDARVLSPWPGAMGYLSRHQVIDLLGRVGSSSGDAEEPTRSWRGPARADVVAALEARPEYIAPLVSERLRPPSRDELIELLLVRHDEIGATPERRADLVEALAPYELVTVPIPEHEQELTLPSASPGLLLRLRELGLAPRLSLVHEDGRVRVQVQHDGHHQVVELEVAVELEDGTVLYLRPDGRAGAERVRARTEMLLFPTGTRRVELLSAALAKELRERGPLTVRARLLTPFSDPTDPLAPACEQVELTLAGD